MTMTMVFSILSAFEAKKSPAKCKPKTQSVQFSTNKPWDTLKAQLLAKISIALNPPIIDFAQYNIMFYISCILPKPGLPLMSQEDFDIMNNQAHNLTTKNPTINLLIVEKKNSGEKEHVDVNVNEEG